MMAVFRGQILYSVTMTNINNILNLVSKAQAYYEICYCSGIIFYCSELFGIILYVYKAPIICK